MQQTVKMLTILLLLLLISGCGTKEIVIVQKPKKSNILEANITQCAPLLYGKKEITEEWVKCKEINHLKVKQERDSLRAWELEVSE